jgi:Terpene cyclase DEP1
MHTPTPTGTTRADRTAATPRPRDQGASITSRERILLVLAIAGFLVPNTMVVIFLAEHGLDLSTYFGHWVDSLPAAQLAADLGIAFLTFALWSTWEARRLDMSTWWLPIPASLLVGLCFALPLFLLLRERAIVALAAATPGSVVSQAPSAR